jgi:hypothetical protein
LREVTADVAMRRVAVSERTGAMLPRSVRHLEWVTLILLLPVVARSQTGEPFFPHPAVKVAAAGVKPIDAPHQLGRFGELFLCEGLRASEYA